MLFLNHCVEQVWVLQSEVVGETEPGPAFRLHVDRNRCRPDLAGDKTDRQNAVSKGDLAMSRGSSVTEREFHLK